MGSGLLSPLIYLRRIAWIAVGLPVLTAASANCPDQFARLPKRRSLTPFVAGSVAAHAVAYQLIRPGMLNPAPPGEGPVTSAFSNLAPPALPEAPRLKIKTEAELIAEAQAMLKAWARTGRWDDRLPDLGEFIIHTELRENDPRPESLDKMRRRYAGVREEVTQRLSGFTWGGRAADSADMMNALEFLNEGPARGYCEQKALMTEFFTEDCGNCEAHSKLLISSLLGPKTNLKTRYRFGLQNYTGHLEPVIWDEETRRTMPLSRGEWEEKSPAPVLDPAAFLVAYLDAKKIPVDASIRERLLIDPGAAEAGVSTHSSDVVTDTRLDWSRLPQGPRRAPGMTNPKFGVRSFGRHRETASSGKRTLARPSVGESKSTPFEVDRDLHCKNGVIRQGDDRLALKETAPREGISMLLEVSHRSGEPKTLNVASSELKNAIADCKNDEDLQHTLVTYYRNRIYKNLNDPGTEALMAYLSDPSKLATLDLPTAQRIHAAWRRLKEIRRDVRLLHPDQMTRTGGLGPTGMPLAELERDLVRFEQWDARFSAALINYSQQIKNQHLTLVQNLDRLSVEEQRKFFLVNQWEGSNAGSLSKTQAHSALPRTEAPFLPIFQAIAAGDITPRAESAPPSNPPRVIWQLQLQPSSTPPPARRAPPAPRQISIDPELMFQWYLFARTDLPDAQEQELKTRWKSQGMFEVAKRKNAKGEWDEPLLAFLEFVSVRDPGPRCRVEENPRRDYYYRDYSCEAAELILPIKLRQSPGNGWRIVPATPVPSTGRRSNPRSESLDRFAPRELPSEPFDLGR